MSNYVRFSFWKFMLDSYLNLSFIVYMVKSFGFSFIQMKARKTEEKKKCHSCQELLTVMSTVIFLIFCVHFFLFLHEAFLIRAINAFVDHWGGISWLSRVPACSHRAKRAIFSLWHYPPNLTHNFLNVDIGLTSVVLFKDLSFIFSHWQINIHTLTQLHTCAKH